MGTGYMILKLINIKHHLKNNVALTMTITRPKNRFGLALCQGNNLISFNEKTTDHRNNWINAGVFVTDYSIFKYIILQNLF